ncbi:MAG: HNH endonuclease [Pseudobdellovibrionaceae bacterium]|nr:HNH endonuclease [Pseudobdellovibrionaceae bacterium]
MDLLHTPERVSLSNDGINGFVDRLIENISDQMMPLERCPALVLNADFRPLSYYPLSVWPWQEAVKAIFRETVVVVSEYARVVHSPGTELKLPSVLALKEYVPMDRAPAFTRFNVFLRDGWQCQYCSCHFRTDELTFDHVIPRSRGGRTSWTNIVASCQCCNKRKGSYLPKEIGMYPMREPRQPSIYELQDRGRKFPPNFLHESWMDFLYWDTELVEQ